MTLSVQELTQAIEKAELLDPGQADRLSQEAGLDLQSSTPKAFLRCLVKSKHLTPFQASALFNDQANALEIGEYLVLDKIGAGGMGDVYKAKHRYMERIVAIKLLPRSAAKNPVKVKRFYREVKVAAKLIHPNIVTAFDAGKHGRTHYLAMEYIAGKDLSALVHKKGPFSLQKAVDYTRQAAEGLSYAHQHGVTHRDIKPANLLLDKHGTIKLLDLGLARLEDDNTESEQSLTLEAAIMGTPEYMAPEQALNAKAADARSDIYALGCTFFRMATGQLPYKGGTVAEKIVAHREQPIPKLTDKVEGCPQRLETVFEKMVAKAPADRYQTMKEAAEAIANCLPMLDEGGVYSNGVDDLDDDSSSDFWGEMGSGATINETDDENSVLNRLAAAAAETPTTKPLKVIPKSAKNKLETWKIAAGGVLCALAALAGWSMLGGDDDKDSGAGEQEVASIENPPRTPEKKLTPEAILTPEKKPTTPSPPAKVVEAIKTTPAPKAEFDSATPSWNWDAASKADEQLNRRNVDHVKFSRDGLQMYSVASGQDGQDDTDIWLSKRTSLDQAWGEMENLGSPLNTEFDEAFPTLSHDELTMVFTVNIKKERGLWYSERKTTQANWGKPRPIETNLKGRSDWPLISTDGLRLIFMQGQTSKGIPSQVWRLTRSERGEPWGKPEQLGKVINEGERNQPMWQSADELRLLFVSNRGDGTRQLYWAVRSNLQSNWQRAIPVDPEHGRLLTGLQYALLDATGELFFRENDSSGNAEWIWKKVPRVGKVDSDVSISHATAPSGWDWDAAEKRLWPFGDIPANEEKFSRDGLRSYFGLVHPSGQGRSDIWQSQRAALDQPWGEPVNVGEGINTSNNEYSPTLSDDELAIVFKVIDSKNETLWYSERETIGAPWEKARLVSTELLSPVKRPLLSSGGMRLMFAINDSATSVNCKVWQMTRLGRGQPWENLEQLSTTINTGSVNLPAWQSVDGLRLLLTSNRDDGKLRLYWAVRQTLEKDWEPLISIDPKKKWDTIFIQAALMDATGELFYREKDSPENAEWIWKKAPKIDKN